jgi:hypothetical protein
MAVGFGGTIAKLRFLEQRVERTFACVCHESSLKEDAATDDIHGRKARALEMETR